MRRNYSEAERSRFHEDPWQVELSVLQRHRPATLPQLSDITNGPREKMPLMNAAENLSARNDAIWHFTVNETHLQDNMSVNESMYPYELGSLTPPHYVLIVLYSFTTILAIFGNSFALVIFCKGKRSKTDLRPFLINLAVADLIMAMFCIPFTFTYQLLDSNWVFSPPMCPIVMFLQVVSVTVSVTTNMAIGIDRFCAIVFPLNASRCSSHRHKVIIFLIWLISIAFGSVQLYVGKTQQMEDTHHITCGEHWPSNDLSLFYTFLVLILTYLVPVVILTVTYSIVGYLLWKRHLPGNADATRDRTQLKSKVKVSTLA